MNQNTALAILQSGRNVFLTGVAGAGKTHVLRQYVTWLRARQVAVAVTASTGLAATHMNGQTLHAWAGIGVREALHDEDLARLAKKTALRYALQGAQVLVIDEISMLHARQFVLVDRVLRHIRQSAQAFGGMQVVLCGDFFQLPPVGARGEASRDKFAFMSAPWLALDLTICYLSEQHRQGQGVLPDILQEIRAGAVSPASRAQLQQTASQSLTGPVTRLYTHNQDVDAINQRQLADLPGTARVFEAATTGSQQRLQGLRQSVRAPAELALKIGARVMFVKNKPEDGVINGTLAEVVDWAAHEMHGTLPRVRLRDGSHRTVSPETWTVENEHGEITASYTQLPLTLAWAITVHKSQGMTLDAAEIDLRQSFEPGQGYVALSRLRSLQGLRLLGMNEQALRLDALAAKADLRFQALSQQAQDAQRAQDASTQRQHSDAFVLRCGGTLDATRIARNQQADKAIAKKPPQAAKRIALGDSRKTTRKLYEQGLDIAAIAAERQLVPGTILSHLLAEAAQDPAFDLSRLRPDATVLHDITAACAAIAARANPEDRKADGTRRLKPVVEALEGRYSYDELRLALLFVDREGENV